MLMTNGMSGAYFVTAATTIFNNRMLQSVVKLAPNLSRETVLATGASELQKAFQGADLDKIRQAYMVGIKAVFAFSIAGAASTAILALIIPMVKLSGHEKKAVDEVEKKEAEPST